MTFVRAGKFDGEAPGPTSPVQSPNGEFTPGNEASGREGTSLAALTKVW